MKTSALHLIWPCTGATTTAAQPIAFAATSSSRDAEKGIMRKQVQEAVTVAWETPGGDCDIRPNNRPDGLGSNRRRSPSDWIAEIQRQVTQGRSATLELAITVCAAKSRLHHGEWTAILKSGRLPFRKRKAEMLFVIGKGLGWLTAHDRAQLPSAFRTLHCLARLDDATLVTLIAERTIHPRLTLRDAEQLVVGFGGHATEKSQKPNVKRRLQRLGDFVHTTLRAWQPEERALAKSELSRLIEEIAYVDADGFERATCCDQSGSLPRGEFSWRFPHRSDDRQQPGISA